MIPLNTAVQADVKMASYTEKIAYLDYALLICRIWDLRVLSVGKQKNPIRPRF
jgi:hypothetical protein